MAVVQVFTHCVAAIRNQALIERVSATDKEFHFQNWFRTRLVESGSHFETGGRNSCPDFRMVATTESYELKGLAYPGRDASFDSNSQVPTGFHNGRTVYYVFGRYPKVPDGNSYPVLDLVICHGDFLNANHDYIHRNKNVKGFGSYGDLIRREADESIVGYAFDLRTNEILPAKVPNPGAGQEHFFRAWRLHGSPNEPVSMRTVEGVVEPLESEGEDAES